MEPVIVLFQESLNTYQIYADITDHFGLKRLLMDLEEDVKSHIQNMEYRDFLQMIVRREEAVAERYEALSAVAANDDSRFSLKRMAEDCRKHVWLARDRYDLETLI